jgi:hypothetical protein
MEERRFRAGDWAQSRKASTYFCSPGPAVLRQSFCVEMLKERSHFCFADGNAPKADAPVLATPLWQIGMTG